MERETGFEPATSSLGSWHPLDESRAHCAMPPLEPSPDLAQFQAKSFDNSFAGEVIDVHQFLGLPPGAVHIDRAPIRINQPPERRPVIDPLAHLRLRLGQPVRRGDQFHYEIRTERQEAFLLFLTELLQPAALYPRSVRRQRGAVGEDVFRVGIECPAASVPLRPHAQLGREIAVTESGFGAGRGHDYDFSVAISLDAEFGILGAELEVFLLVHRALSPDFKGGAGCTVREDDLHTLRITLHRPIGQKRYLLYPIIRKNPRRFSASSAPSTPFGTAPSITPSTPRPSSLSATTTCTAFAVAQKMEHTSGTSLIRPSTLIGYPSVMTTTKMCPAAMALAFFAANTFNPSSLPSTRVRHGPDASLNATPNFICGTVFTMAS